MSDDTGGISRSAEPPVISKGAGSSTLASASAALLSVPALVLALCFFFNFTGRGVGDTYMVFLLPLGSEFGWHRSQLTSVYSAFMVVSGLAAPLAGLVFERWGPRVLYGCGLALLATGYFLAGRLQHLWQFYVCISLMGGLGLSALGMVPVAALMSRWFQDRLSTAIGIAYGGFGCGSLVVVPLAQALIDQRGWRQAYQFIGAALVAVLVLCMLMPWRTIRAGNARSRANEKRRPGRQALAPLREAVRRRPFWLLVQVTFFTALGMYLIIVQSVAYLIDIGFSPLNAATAFGTAAMLSVFGVTIVGWLADRFGYKRAATLSFASTLSGVLLLYALSYQSSHWLLAAYVVLFGICQGARGPITASLSARLFSSADVATIFGTIYAGMSIGAGIGALLSGVLHDLTGGYRATFALSVVCLLIAAAPFWTSDALVPAARRLQDRDAQ